MFWTIKVVIGDGERGLVYRNRRFQQMLLPGVHRLSPFGGRPHVDIHTASKGAAYTGSDQDSLIEALGATLDTHFVLANVSATEVGLLLRNGRIDEVLPPGSRRLYWRGSVDTQVRVMALGDEPRIPADVQQRLGQLGVLPRVAVICISKPGLRVYAKSTNLPRVLGGLGVAIISTSSGLLTDRQAADRGVGGEVLAYVW